MNNQTDTDYRIHALQVAIHNLKEEMNELRQLVLKGDLK